MMVTMFAYNCIRKRIDLASFRLKVLKKFPVTACLNVKDPQYLRNEDNLVKLIEDL